MSSQFCTTVDDSSLFFFRFLRPPRWRFSPPKNPLTSSSSPSAVQSASVTFVTGFGVAVFVFTETDSWLTSNALGGIAFCTDDFDFGFCMDICGRLVGWNLKEAIQCKESAEEPWANPLRTNYDLTQGADLYLPALICCFWAGPSSGRESSPWDCLKTTGARDMVPGVVVDDDEGSRRLA